MKIRTKLLGLLLAAAVLPVAVSGLWSIAISKEALEKAVLERQRERAATYARETQQLIQDSFHALISAERYLPLATLEKREAGAVLGVIYRQFDRFNLVALFDDDGVSVGQPAYAEDPDASPELRGHEGVLPRDVDLFQQNVPLDAALASGRAIGSVYHSAAGLPRVVLALRVESGNAKRRGPRVLVAELSLTSIQRRLEAIRSESTQALEVDSAYTVIISGNSGLEPGATVAYVKPLASETEPTAREIRTDNGSYVVGHARLPIGWAVIVQQDRDVAFAAVSRMRRQTLFWIAASLVIAAIIAIFFGQSLARPITALAASAQALAKGTFARLEIRSHDEIGQLSGSFNDMAEAIEQRDLEIRAWNEELQQRVDDQTRELKEAQEQLFESRKLAAMAELGAGAAHEINNPLGVVQGMSELLLIQHADNADIADAAQLMLDECRRISAIVKQLHALSSSGGTARARIDLNRLIDATVSEQQPRLDEAKVRVQRSLAESLPPIGGDPTALGQVFEQLIDNARQAMPDGGDLTLATSFIEGGAVRFVCRDTGIGIPQDKIGRIFEPFYTTKTNWTGTGMGLAVARKVVEDHAGAIKVESTMGEGTAITITFPVLPDSAHLY